MFVVVSNLRADELEQGREERDWVETHVVGENVQGSVIRPSFLIMTVKEVVFSDLD